MKHGYHVRMTALALLIVTGLILAPSSTSTAQPTLNLKRIVNNWPMIELYFSVGCNGSPAYFTDKSYFKVVENGVEIKDFNLDCPDPGKPKPSSVALVFDASGSMFGAGNTEAKAAGHAFVNQMDSTRDEAAVLWFNNVVTTRQTMTSSGFLLRSAIDSLPFGGATAVWDGAYAGINEVVLHASKSSRAVIVITDGQDSQSMRQPAEIIALANRNRIRVFTIGIGSSINSAQLQAIANLTGGRYYETPMPTQLTAILQEIFLILGQGFDECVITYNATCMDGGTRTVDLSIKNFCGGNDTQTKTYKALRDTSTFTPIRLRAGIGEGNVGSNVRVPLEILDTIGNALLYPAGITLLYNTACMHCDSVLTPPGTLLAGVPITLANVPGGVQVTVTNSTLLPPYQPPAPLAYLSFHSVNAGSGDTSACALTVSSWAFTAGCYKPVPSDGMVRFINRKPEIVCAQGSMPDSIRWDFAKKDYSSNPITITARVNNIGQLPAYNARFRLKYDPAQMSLIPLADSLLIGTPPDINAAGFSTAQWNVRLKPRTADGFVAIPIEVEFDNHPTVVCTPGIWVSAADVVLTCSAGAPTISVDRPNKRYDPMPFALQQTVWNEGGRGTALVASRIVLPPGLLKLAGPDSALRTRSVNPSVLGPGQFGTVLWSLTHPLSTVEKQYTVGFWTKTANADSSYCEAKVIIPGYPVAILATQCSAPDTLAFDNATGEHAPDPFNVSISCRNMGSFDAVNVAARLLLPPEFELDASELGVTTKQFTPSLMAPYINGNPVPKLIWRVRCKSPSPTARLLPVRFEVFGQDPGSPIALDTARTTCSIRVPGVATTYACVDIAQNPDSLIRDAAGTGLIPDPVPWRSIVRNSGSFSSVIVDAEIATSSGLTVDASTPAVQHPSLFLKNADTTSVSWILHPQYSQNRRVDTIVVTFTDDRGQKQICTRLLPVQSVSASLSCLLTSAEHFLFYNENTRRYVPDTWTVTGTLRNDGKIPLTNIQATIGWNDPNAVRLAEFNPAFPDNSNPKTSAGLVSGQQTQFTWGFRVAAPNLRNDTAMVGFSISYNSTEVPLISSGCTDSVGVGPAGTTGIGDISGVAGFELDQNYPNPFYRTTTIGLRIAQPFSTPAGGVMLKVFDAYGREVRSIPLTPAAQGEYAVTFDATGLSAGLYEYRVSAAGRSVSRRMMVVK